MNKSNPKNKKKTNQALYQQKIQSQLTVLGRYQIIQNIGQGISSKVFLAIDIDSGQKYAVKKIKNFLQSPKQSLRILRELLLLRRLKHPNIVNLRQVILEKGDPKKIALVMEYLPFDLKKIFKSNLLVSYQNIKNIIYQILLGLQYCQQSQVLHRDLKPQNVLITPDFKTVKLCDFGLARAVTIQQQKTQNDVDQIENLPNLTLKSNQTQYSQSESKMEDQSLQLRSSASSISSTQSSLNGMRGKTKLTAHVVTRWYRAPQLILLQKTYTNAIDMWSIGCIFGQLLTMTGQFTQRRPLFPGKHCHPLSPHKFEPEGQNLFKPSAYDQLSIIFSIIGTPHDIDFLSNPKAKEYLLTFQQCKRKPFTQIFLDLQPEAQDFLLRTLQFNPNKRLTISQAINHKLFEDIRQQFKDRDQIKGQPIKMRIQQASLEQIQQILLNQIHFYESKRNQ